MTTKTLSEKILTTPRHEKSCGAVIFHKFNNNYKVLLINFFHNNKLIWGFPKGHMQSGENEIQTAKREIKEEVGLDVHILPRFRKSVSFSMKSSTINEAIYYCAKSADTTTCSQEGEVEKTSWVTFDEALQYLTYECDKNVFTEFIDFFKKYKETNF